MYDVKLDHKSCWITWTPFIRGTLVCNWSKQNTRYLKLYNWQCCVRIFPSSWFVSRWSCSWKIFLYFIRSFDFPCSQQEHDGMWYGRWKVQMHSHFGWHTCASAYYSFAIEFLRLAVLRGTVCMYFHFMLFWNLKVTIKGSIIIAPFSCRVTYYFWFLTELSKSLCVSPSIIKSVKNVKKVNSVLSRE